MADFVWSIRDSMRFATVLYDFTCHCWQWVKVKCSEVIR